MKRLLAAMLCIGSSMAGANEFFAMDNGLRDVKTIAGKADLLKELGYDGVTWRSGRTAEAVRDFASRGIKMHAFKLKLPVSGEVEEAPLPLADLKGALIKLNSAFIIRILASLLSQTNLRLSPMKLRIFICGLQGHDGTQQNSSDKHSHSHLGKMVQVASSPLPQCTQRLAPGRMISPQ